MRKLTVVLALALIVSLAAPVSAFVDVPDGHWAEEYIEKVVEVGIITGMPDGTFRGGENLTRYEAAVITARIMEWVDEVTDEFTDIYQLERELRNVGLNDQQAEEVLLMIRALTNEFRHDIAELKEMVQALEDEEDEQAMEKIEEVKAQLGTDVKNLRSDLMVLMGEHFDLEFFVLQMEDAVEELVEDYEALEERVVALEEPALSFSLDPSFEYSHYRQIEGPGTAYTNPFEHSHAAHPAWWGDDLLPLGEELEYELPLGIHGRTDKVEMDLTLELVKDGTLVQDLDWTELTGTVVTPAFDLTLDDELDAAPVSYIEVEEEPGGIINFANGSFSFLYDGTSFYNIGQLTQNFVDPVETTFTLGSWDFDQQYVLGLANVATFDPFSLSLDFATSDVEDMEYFATAGVGIDLDMVSIDADYTMGTDGFTALGTGDVPAEGLGVNADASLGILNLGAWYTDKYDLGTDNVDENIVGGSVALAEALTFGPMALDANMTYEQDLDADDMHYDLRHVSLSTAGEIYDFVLAYDHEKGPGRPWTTGWWVPGAWYQVGEKHEITADLTLTPMDILTVGLGAEYDFDRTVDLPVEIDGSLTVTPMAWLTAGASVGYDLGDDTDPLSASVNANAAPGPYALLGFDVAPSAGFWYGITAEAMNYDLGLTLDREVAEELVWSTAATWDYRELNFHAATFGHGHIDGRWFEISTGLEYCGIANLDFVWGDYESISDDTDDYQYTGVEAGIGLSF